MTSQHNGTPGERTMSTQEAREHWATILREVRQRGEPTTITHYGTPVARVVPYTDQRGLSRAGFQELVNACIQAHWCEDDVVEMFGEYVDRHGFDMAAETPVTSPAPAGELQRLADTLTAVRWDPAAVVGLVAQFLAAQGIVPTQGHPAEIAEH